MKKVLSVFLAVVLVFSFASCGQKEIINPELVDSIEEASSKKESTPETVDEITVLLKEQAIPGKNNSGLYQTSAFRDMAKQTGDYKYVIYEEKEGEKLDISAYPEEDFKKLYEDKQVPDYLEASVFKKESDVFGSIMQNAEVVLNNLTNTEGLLTNVPENGENSYISFNNTGDIISAFGIPIDADKGLIQVLKDENLNLVFNNLKVRKLIGSDSMASDLWGCCAIVDAEVTCISNDGAFKDISWIPEKGNFKNVEFTILYMSYSNDDIHAILVNDIAAEVIE